MKHTRGTPVSLKEAIRNGMEASEEEGRFVTEDHVVDFLNQRFGAAVLRASDCTLSAEQQILDLYSEITGRVIR